LTPDYRGTTQVSLKRKVPKLFHWKNKRSCAVRTCNYAVRFTDYFVGTQFHPEADPVSFVSHLRNKEAKEKKKKHEREKNSKLCLKT
jgi:hypothetical protein